MSNEQNIFRSVYRELTDKEKEAMERIKDIALELYGTYPKTDDKPMNREIAVAITKLEESVMWAIKGITKQLFLLVYLYELIKYN